ncbi:MAG: hypothetical protein V1875_03995 [Candidatus Altiarchaeota archaeon]
MDCKLMICEMLNEMKAVKSAYLEEQLIWQGMEKVDIDVSLKSLLERGVIYRRKGGILELTEPANN